MAIVTRDGLVAALTSAQRFQINKASVANMAAGNVCSLWGSAGFPAAGANPATGSGAAPDRTTLGAIPFSAIAGGSTAYLARLAGAISVAGSLMVYDRLVHTSGLSGTTASPTAQTVNTTPLTRYTSGAGVECWLEWYTDTGATAVTATVSYTNQNGTPGQSGTCSLAATRRARTMLQVTLAAGDTGVRSVESVTLSASTLTAGNFGVTLLKRHSMLGFLIVNVSFEADYARLAAPEIDPSACLALAVLCTTTTSGLLLGELSLMAG